MTPGGGVLNTPVMRQLDDSVREFQLACAHDAIEPALMYFDLHALEIWFGCAPHRLRELLGDLISRGAPQDSVVAAVYAFLLGDPVPRPLQSTRLNEAVLPEADAFVQMYEHRVAGRTDAALAASAQVLAARIGLDSVFDRRGGWNLFLSVQLGTTAMLAGELSQALGFFGEARMHPPSPVLRCLLREACAKEALLEACEGSLENARLRLREAREIERSTSWSEPGIDAILAVVEAILDPHHETAEQRIAEIPLGQIGEIWPYYVIARNRVLAMRGAYTESERMLERLDSMALTRVPGVGYPGSIIALVRTSLRLGVDDPRGAEVHLATVDPGLQRSYLMQALVSLNLGQPRRALQRVLDMPEPDRDMRQIAVWRHVILAAAHLRLDELDEVRSVLDGVMRLPGAFTAEDARQFDLQVREFAEANVVGWPATDAPAGPFARAAGTTGRHLTEREIEVLRLLAAGHARDEIAATLFISLNTLKTQLRSIYRKLEVSQRSAAVLEAQRRGLV